MTVQKNAKCFPAIAFGKCDGEIVQLAGADFHPPRPRATISRFVCGPLALLIRTRLKVIKHVTRGVAPNPDRFLASILIRDRKLYPCAPSGRTPGGCDDLLGITNHHYQPRTLCRWFHRSYSQEYEDGANHDSHKAEASNPK